MGVSRDFLTDWLTVTVAARLSELSHDQSIEKIIFWNIFLCKDYEHNLGLHS